LNDLPPASPESSVWRVLTSSLQDRLAHIRRKDRPELGPICTGALFDHLPSSVFVGEVLIEGAATKLVSDRFPEWSVTWDAHANDELDCLVAYDRSDRLVVRWGYGIIRIPVEAAVWPKLVGGRPMETEFKIMPVHVPLEWSYPHAEVNATRRGDAGEIEIVPKNRVPRAIKRDARMALMLLIRDDWICRHPRETSDLEALAAEIRAAVSCEAVRGGELALPEDVSEGLTARVAGFEPDLIQILSEGEPG